MTRSSFKRDELAFELRHEDAAMGVYNRHNDRSVTVSIDGRFWKTMPIRQATKAAATLRAKGKEVTIL